MNIDLQLKIAKLKGEADAYINVFNLLKEIENNQ